MEESCTVSGMLTAGREGVVHGTRGNNWYIGIITVIWQYSNGFRLFIYTVYVKYVEIKEDSYKGCLGLGTRGRKKLMTGSFIKWFYIQC